MRHGSVIVLSLLVLQLCAAVTTAQELPIFRQVVIFEEQDSFGYFDAQADILPSDAKVIPLVLRLDEAQVAAFDDLYDAYRAQRIDAGQRMKDYTSRVSQELSLHPDNKAVERQSSDTWKRYNAFRIRCKQRLLEDLDEILTDEQRGRMEGVSRLAARSALTRHVPEGLSHGQTADVARLAAYAMRGEPASVELLDALDRYELDAGRTVEAFTTWRAEVWAKHKRDWDAGIRLSREEQDQFQIEYRLDCRAHLRDLAAVNLDHAERVAAVMPAEEAERFRNAFYSQALLSMSEYRHDGVDFDEIMRHAVAGTRGTEQSDGVARVIAEYGAEKRRAEKEALEALREQEARMLADRDPELVNRSAMPGPGFEFAQSQYQLGLKMVDRLRSVLTEEQMATMPPPLGESSLVPPIFE